MFPKRLILAALCLPLTQPSGLRAAPVPMPKSSQVIYDLDFSAPDHPLDQTVAIGGGPKRVTSVPDGTPTVRSSSGVLTARPLEFDALTSYESVLLRLPETPPLGYRIDFDVASTALVNSSYTFTMSLDTPETRSLSLHGGMNKVSIFQPEPSTISNPLGLVDGYKYRFTIIVDFQSVPQWRVYMDSVLIYQKTLGAQNLQSIRFTLAPWIGGASNAPLTKVALDNVTVLAGDFSSYAPTPPPLSAWRFLHGLAVDGSRDLGNPGGDGISNLLKFAFNLAPNAGNLARPASPRTLAPGGLRGLPRIATTGDAWALEYIRRKSGLTYQPEMNTSLDPAQWTPVDGARQVTSIDDTWERVVEVIPRPTGAPGAFLRIRVSSNP